MSQPFKIFQQKKKFISLWIFFLIIFCRIVSTQTNNLKSVHLSLEEGLSQSNVRCLLQDKTGFIWLGTQDGLNRFDGYGFTVYKHDYGDSNSLSDNLVTCLIEDKEGYLWIGTSDGLNKFDPVKNRFTRFLTDPNDTAKLRGKSILSLLEDKNGAIWVGTYSGGLSRYDKKKKQFVTYINDQNNPYSLSNNSIIALYEDDAANLWIGTYGGGLDKFDKTSGKFYHYKSKNKNSIKSNFITALCGDNTNVYIGTPEGLNIFNYKNQRFETYNHNEKNPLSLCSNKIQSLFRDRSGKVWIGTEDNGVDQFDPDRKIFIHDLWKTFESEGEKEKYITSLLMDNNGILWLGTHTDGLYKLVVNSKKFEIFKHDPKIENSISNSSIRAIFEDHLKNLWIGTDNGLNKIDFVSKKIVRYTADSRNPHSLSNNLIWSIDEDKSGNIWIGTQYGLNKFDPIKKQFQRFVNNPGSAKGIPFNIIKYVHVDKEGLIWLGTFAYGLIRYNPINGSFKTFSKNPADPNAISDNVILQIIEDSKNDLWICTSQGLNKFIRDGEKFIRYSKESGGKNSIDVNTIYSILEDERGDYWLGTHGGGFIKLNNAGKKIKRYDESNGLSNNVVYGILQDSKKNFWLSTNNGLSKFNPVTEQFKNYDANDGLPSNEFNAGAFLKSSSGKYFFGSIKGMVAFFPDSIEENKKTPPIAITKFKIFEKALPGKNLFADGDEIELSYNDNFFSLEFAALDFTESSKNQYQYLLEGFDPDWVQSGSRRYASYTQVNPGRYVFKVRASNNDGVWNDKGASIIITITPPFWKTWWFRFAVGATLFAIAFYLYERRISRFKKEKDIQQRFSKQLIDSQEGERMRIASELHDSIGQNLIIIKNRAAMAFDNASHEYKNEQLNEIAGISSQTINDVREISYNLRPYQLGKLGLTKAIEAVTKSAAAATKINYNIAIDNIDNILPEESEIHFYRIVQECLNNTIKHSQASEVTVKISKNENQLLLSYSDNGVGFSKDSLISAKEKIGMGMYDISERVKILEGSFGWESEPNHGMKISIQIPGRKI